MNGKIAKWMLISTMITLISGCSDRKPETDLEKQSYAAGVRLAQVFHKNSIKLDDRMVELAMSDVSFDKKLRLNEQELKTAQVQLAESVDKARFQRAGENLKESEKKIEEYLKQEGTKRTDSGLIYKVIKEGKGAHPKETDTIITDYTGKLPDGLIFDSSVQRGSVAEFQVNGLVPGLKEAFKMMRVGSKYEFLIPPKLGYGESGNSTIPPNSALIFELELKGIK